LAEIADAGYKAGGLGKEEDKKSKPRKRGNHTDKFKLVREGKFGTGW